MANLQDLEITNGKDFTKRQRELEELLGINKISPFGTYELEVFEENIKGATHADLQKIAQRVGLNPFLDRGRLKNALVKEFKAYSKNSRRNLIPQAPQQIKLDKNNPKHAKTKPKYCNSAATARQRNTPVCRGPAGQCACPRERLQLCAATSSCRCRRSCSCPICVGLL